MSEKSQSRLNKPSAHDFRGKRLGRVERIYPKASGAREDGKVKDTTTLATRPHPIDLTTPRLGDRIFSQDDPDSRKYRFALSVPGEGRRSGECPKERVDRAISMEHVDQWRGATAFHPLYTPRIFYISICLQFPPRCVPPPGHPLSLSPCLPREWKRINNL